MNFIERIKLISCSVVFLFSFIFFSPFFVLFDFFFFLRFSEINAVGKLKKDFVLKRNYLNSFHGAFFFFFLNFFGTFYLLYSQAWFMLNFLGKRFGLFDFPELIF